MTGTFLAPGHYFPDMSRSSRPHTAASWSLSPPKKARFPEKVAMFALGSICVCVCVWQMV